MRIVLTGASGFIGSHLVADLATRHDVVAVGRDEPPALPDGVRWVTQDLARGVDPTLLPAEVDAVVHLAQSKHYRSFPEGADDVFAINVESTFDLLEYARHAGARTYVYASSGGVYGGSEHAFSEGDRLNPLNFYLSSKYAAEALVASYRSIFTTVIFRFFFVYGPGQRAMLIPSLVEKVLAGDEIVIEGNPGLRINPIFVGDAARVFEPALALEESELVNVAGDEAVTITDLVALVGDVTGVEPNVVHADAAPAGDLVGDNTRMKRVLGVVPATTLRDGLAATARALAPSRVA